MDVLSLIVGLVYGYAKHGKEKRGELLRKGAMFGAGLGVVLAVINLLLGGGILLAGATTVGATIAIVYLTVLFVIGTWIGDWLEAKKK